MIYLGFALVLCLIDLIIKLVVEKKMIEPIADSVAGVKENTLVKKDEKHICEYLKIVPLYNQGAAMGFLKNYKGVLNVITLVAVTALCTFFGIALKTGTTIEKIGYAMVNAGAWNNAYERIVKGKVTDYINFPKFPGRMKDIVFNLSDFFIMIGALLLIIKELFQKR